MIIQPTYHNYRPFSHSEYRQLLITYCIVALISSITSMRRIYTYAYYTNIHPLEPLLRHSLLIYPPQTWTAGNRIEIWSASSLFDFQSPACTRTVLWRPPPNTPYSGDIWAPEIHSLHGRWYIYFAADDPSTKPKPNYSHRMFVLEGPSSQLSPLDPNAWKFAGRVGGMPDQQWAIDGTVVELQGQHYFIYSGWPLENNAVPDESKQELFILRMKNPTECDPTPPTRISTPDFQWEYSGRSGINEGPQLLVSPDEFGKWVGIVYSCAGSWTSEYKMGVLKFLPGSDPMDPKAWVKRGEPLLKCRRDGRPPYGPGHGNFVVVDAAGGDNPDSGGRININSGGKEVWAVFHATDRRTGWEGRRARVMRVGWGEDGPYMGSERAECGYVCECGDLEGFLYGEADRPNAGRGGGGGKNIKGELKGMIVGVGKDIAWTGRDLLGTGKGLVQKFRK